MSAPLSKVRSVEQRPTANVEHVASAALPTRHGDFSVHGFRVPSTGEEIVALTHGTVAGASDVPTRIHSQCFTGDVLGSLRCDCQEQLDGALDFIGTQKSGILIYLPQEGRGIGLLNKIRAYALQEDGLDTVDANLALGFKSDLRIYDSAADILKHLAVTSVRLMTNNLEKIEGIQAAGVVVSGRIPLAIASNGHNDSYLETKRTRCGHLL